jgi:hypothetical protein
MVRLCCQVLMTLSIVVCSLLIMTTAGIAEVRSKPAATNPMKPAPEKSTQGKSTQGKSIPAQKGVDQANSVDSPGGANDVDPLADDDSPKGKSSGKNTKENAKKKSDPKGTKDSKSPAGKRPGGKRPVDTAPDQQGLVGVDLNLEPET